jgi:tetratricopeptide (TPR) repeat protein
VGFAPRLAIWRQLKLTFVVAFLMLALTSTAQANALSREDSEDDEVCDPLADYFLGLEDYVETIRLHRKVIARTPSNALAHYHLGYAYGMVGRSRDELREYQLAVELGLSDWDLFLNLGLLYQEDGRLQDAADAFKTAIILGPDRAEAHYNLGLIYERQGKLHDALQEMLIAVQLDPDQPDTLNMLGVIYAEMGDYVRAQKQWSELVTTEPDYEPARINLSRLRAQMQVQTGSKTVSAADPARQAAK